MANNNMAAISSCDILKGTEVVIVVSIKKNWFNSNGPSHCHIVFNTDKRHDVFLVEIYSE